MTHSPSTSQLSQVDKLDVLIAAAQRARICAEHGLLFADRKGAALLNAIHDLTEIDAVYDAMLDCERECGMYSEAAE